MAGGAYLSVGIALGRRAGGRPGLSAHPHFVRWQELQVLCLDGLAYSRGAGSKVNPLQAGYKQVGGAQPSKEGHRERRRHGSKAKKEKRHSTKHDDGEETSASKLEEKPRTAMPNRGATQDAKQDTIASSSSPSGGGGRWVHVPG